jgi:hypothetical protein
MAIIGNSLIQIAENTNTFSETTRSNDIILLASSLAKCYDPPPFYSPLPTIARDWWSDGFWHYLDVARENCNQSECVLQNMYLVGEM